MFTAIIDWIKSIVKKIQDIVAFIRKGNDEGWSNIGKEEEATTVVA